MTVRLGFDRGTITVDGSDAEAVPFTTVDDRSGTIRAPAYRYATILETLDEKDIPVEDTVLALEENPTLTAAIDLRPYQQEAIDQWTPTRRGVIVLPTGAGKTYVGMAAIEIVDTPALIVVPTLDLVDQWVEELRVFGVEIGEYSGREKSIGALTVTTYDSAYAHAERIGNRFGFVLFDEVHHLPATGYRHIATAVPAPARLGLTATFERADGAHEVLTDLLGGRVFDIDTEALTGTYLADYSTERISVELTPTERREYDALTETFRDYLRSADVAMRGPQDYQKLVLRSGNDPAAWEAVRARNAARKLAYGSAAKLDVLEDLLKRHRDDRIIIFTRYNELVYRVADRFLIPPITHRTDSTERRTILDRFRSNRYSAIVSSQVLDEGIDVPDANVGIILSGTGSVREYRQRLGRILRPSGTHAQLYEIVASDTGELRTASRRSG